MSYKLIKIFVVLFIGAIFLHSTTSRPDSVDAATGYIDPNGNGTTGGTPTTCGGGGEYDCLNDAVRSPSTPSTTSDYVTFGNNGSSFYDMATISGLSIVTRVDVYVYHQESKTNMNLSVSLYDTDETTQYGSTSTLANSTSATWATASFTGLSLDQTQLDNLNVHLSCVKNGGGSPGDCIGYAMYADVTYASVSISMSTDGVISFGTIAENSTVDTTASGINDVETVSVDSGPADLDVKSTTFGDGGQTWSLSTSSGSDQVHWEFSPDGSTWTSFAAADTNYALATNVGQGSTQDMYFRLTTPTTTGSYNEFSTTVTVTGSAP